MSEEDLKRALLELKAYCPGLSVEEMRELIKKLATTRYLAAWHDEATLDRKSFWSMVVHELYDPIRHYSDEEYAALHPNERKVNVQQAIEDPQLYILAPSDNTFDGQMKWKEDRLQDIR